jgi:hypothetical protein
MGDVHTGLQDRWTRARRKLGSACMHRVLGGIRDFSSDIF